MIRITCRCCNGTGKAELTGEYAETFKVFKQLVKDGEEVTGAEFGRTMKIKPTAMNNRLKQLASYGLLVARPHGRKTFYRVADAIAKAKE